MPNPPKPKAETFDSVWSLYAALGGPGKAETILGLQSWLTAVTGCDPDTGRPLCDPATGRPRPMSLLDLMDEAARAKTGPTDEVKDRVYRIAAHTLEAVRAILARPRVKILREQARLPLHAVREVDNAGLRWLSRQPGRTVREKLAGKPYMQAVKRRLSPDTAENRLLKAFLLRLGQVLEARRSALTRAAGEKAAGETCEYLLTSLQRWLRDETAEEIGGWGHLPPNNALLQDRNYRKVWAAWIWLQSLDDNIARDAQGLERDLLKVVFWKTLALLHGTGRFRTVQQPLSLEYDNFEIQPSWSPVIRGYLFPVLGLHGVIDDLNPEKGSGSIDGCVFHASDLAEGTTFQDLLKGQRFRYESGISPEGQYYAKGLRRLASPEEVRAELLGDRLAISAGRASLTVTLKPEGLALKTGPGSGKVFPPNLPACDKMAEVGAARLLGPSSAARPPKPARPAQPKAGLAVIDLFSIRPQAAGDADAPHDLPFRLLWQYSEKYGDGTPLELDCGQARAVALRPDAETKTLSLRRFFSPASTFDPALKFRTAKFFAEKIKKHLPADSLLYLVPDWIGDFELDFVRNSLGLCFGQEKATPLPRSIAAVCAWQSAGGHGELCENAPVLVVEAFDGGLALSPVRAVVRKGLREAAPETGGFGWDLHPVFIDETQNPHSGPAKRLSLAGRLAGEDAEEWLRLLGLDGLLGEAADLSLVADDKWYDLLYSVREDLAPGPGLTLSEENLKECLGPDFLKSPFFILPLTETLRKTDFGPRGHWLAPPRSLVKGAQDLLAWQKSLGDDTPIWTSHLPDLRMRITKGGRPYNFYVVKNATAIPKRGEKNDIKVEEQFELPAGNDFYNFPLRQGQGRRALRYAAHLKSPQQFPFKTPTKCDLRMTYTYGNDPPYELDFIPVEPKGSKPIRVEWRPVEVKADLAPPPFPKRETWAELQVYQNWCRTGLSTLRAWLPYDVDKTCQQLISARKTGSFKNGKYNEYNKYFCFVTVNGIDYYCPGSRFIEPIDENALKEGHPVYFNLITDKQVTLVSFSEPKPPDFHDKFITHVREMIYEPRLPVFTIWNYGRSIYEPEAPAGFKKDMLEGIAWALAVWESETRPDIKEALFFFLCSLHKDAPGPVADELIKAVTDKKLLKYRRNIAHYLGDAELEQQKRLLASMVNQGKDEIWAISLKLEILAIAFWRSEKLVLKLKEPEFKALCLNLRRCLENDLREITQPWGQTESRCRTLGKHLELLLALLRMRGGEDESLKTLLAPGQPRTDVFEKLVEEATDSDYFMKSGFERWSYISLKVDKPDQYRNTPDLLYALLTYLTGDTGANTISIAGKNPDE